MAIGEVEAWRVVSKCDGTQKIQPLSSLISEAVQTFYDEFDYYPDVAAYAPGKFTIMGDHIEYVKGNLIQAALPLGTVVVGKSLNTIKCKIITTSPDVEGLRKAVFPLSQYLKNLKVFPEWVNFIKGVISSFPNPHMQGFDAVIHSNVPIGQGRGSSAALQVAFFTFLEAIHDRKCIEDINKKAILCQGAEERCIFQNRVEPKSNSDINRNKSCVKIGCSENEKANICQRAEGRTVLCGSRIGQWDNFTSFFAQDKTCVKIDCSKSLASTFDLREIDILFLLTYPKFEIESNDRDIIPRREMELYVAAKLLGLENVIDATGKDLEVLANMEDPTRETVMEMLRDVGIDEECIVEFVEDLFNLPQKLDFSGDSFYGEGDNDLEMQYSDLGEGRSIEGQDTEKEACSGLDNEGKLTTGNPSSYIHARIAELCAGVCASGMDLPNKICEEINCLGATDNLSKASDINLSVTAKLSRRLRHVISENMRSQELPEIVSRLDFVEFGTRLIQSHLSLKLDFEVSCPTLDGLVQLAIDTEKVYGAKMMSGGGTLTLLHRKVAEKFIQKVIEKFGDCFQFYLVFPSPGATTVDLNVKSNPKSALSKKYLNRAELMRKAVENFEATYKYRPTHGAYSPGIIDLIGDHTDYNHGLSLAAGIGLLVVVVGAFNGTDKARVATTVDVGEEPQKVIFPLTTPEELGPGNVKWAAVIRGTTVHFKGDLRGFDCIIESTIPFSHTISSNVACTTAMYTFFEELTGTKTKDLCEKVRRCSLAEYEFSPLLRGISHQHVSVRAKEDHVLLFDSKTIRSTLVPFPDKSVTLLLTFLKKEVKNNLGLLYTRIEECYDVAKALGAKTLRCLTLKELEILKSTKIRESSLRRAQHIILENERVLRATEALKNNDFETLGEIMIASHNSLRNNYEVTTPDLDFLVERSMEVDGVFGSKMPCYGRAVCVMSLVKHWAVDDLIEYLQNSFAEDLDFYLVDLYDACGPLKVKEYVETLHSPQFAFEDIFPI